MNRNVQRKLDRLHKKEHIPVADKTPDLPPPIIIAVQGPTGVGKSTLIRGLVKHHTRQNVLPPFSFLSRYCCFCAVFLSTLDSGNERSHYRGHQQNAARDVH